jgi:RNA 3'-terminal phosphate cyclase-like protein
LKPIQLLDEGKVRRIRGVAYSTRVSPQTANRLVDAAKGVLNKYQQDTFIYADTYKGGDSGLYVV